MKELARRNRVHTRKPLQLPKTHEGQMALVIRVKGYVPPPSPCQTHAHTTTPHTQTRHP